MKKASKRIILIVGAFILTAATVILINVFPFLSMKPTETGKIADTEILAIKNKLNSLYFIELNGEYILIDAGSDLKAIEKIIVEENMNPSNVKYILLTHSDSDHVASLNLFSNATIYMSEDELQMINGETKRSGNKSNSLPDDIEQTSLILLKDEQELTIGEHEIKCIKVPGHTPGSMAYIVDGNYLFSGDSFKINNNTLDIHPFTMDNETSKKTNQKLFEMIKATKLTLTAHYGYYKSSELKLD